MQPLRGSFTLTGGDIANGHGAILATYDINFSLNPDYVCGDCKIPWYSSVGPANQVLGEELPIVGTPFTLNYDSGRTAGAAGASLLQGDTVTVGGWMLSAYQVYDPAGDVLYLSDGSQRNAWQLGSP